MSDLLAEPDSFERQREALLRLARRLKRVPTQDEALAFIKEKKLYTGTWEENLARRIIRVRDILRFIEGTFDAARYANGSVNVGKYDGWAEEKFPVGLTGRTSKGMDEHGNVTQGQAVHVGTSFIAVFLAVAEFALLTDKNEDSTLPHRRAEQLWEALYSKGLTTVRFDARKWAVCRDELERHGIIRVTDRNYGHGKAMKWAPGLYFPFQGLWKTNKQPSLLGPGKLTGAGGEEEGAKQPHNTLLCTQPALGGVEVHPALSRPPPGIVFAPVK